MSRAHKRAFALVLEEEYDDLDDIFVNRRPRFIKERTNDFENLDELDFVTRYRLSKKSVLHILERIEDQLEYNNNRNNGVSPINQLLCTLRFYATGCFQGTAGDLCGVSAATVNRIVHKVSRAIASLWRDYILFPETDEEIKRTQRMFYQKAKFPRVIGAIDCTHIKFWQSPGGEVPESYRNRKGYFSLNVQVICNSNLEITDIVARYPGCTHDARIWRQCQRRARFERGEYGDAVLVGDSGYGCRRYMMTPLDQCHTEAEHLYNESQIRTRNPVERTFGVWKRRFPALALGLRVKLKNILPIITATAVLHNIARRAGEDIPINSEVNLSSPWEEILVQDDIPVPLQRDLPHRRITQDNRERQTLVDLYFERMVRL
ncbi:putative nuclease HARBI1 [Acyrthosiphon pisum]|uniref:Putative nuclease HARBI1 n=1 Tax=Acyrthosiphon pisum TaxID=7029 RepID=A0A8R2FA41_ACYPI|nr:putative nuclease HARBI1 [Acyrthosiphon pisum]|eukprot:XP_008185493.1 PREDICTED: putative nuclease HARBI1 [Acyrthosiphon pisum]